MNDKGLMRARERAEAFNARVDAQRKLEALTGMNQRLHGENQALNRDIKKLTEVLKTPLHKAAMQHAGRELADHMMRIFVEKIKEVFPEDTPEMVGLIAQKVCYSEDFHWLPRNMQNAFREVMHRMQVDARIPIPSYGPSDFMDRKLTVETRIYWEPCEFHYMVRMAA